MLVSCWKTIILKEMVQPVVYNIKKYLIVMWAFDEKFLAIFLHTWTRSDILRSRSRSVVKLRSRSRSEKKWCDRARARAQQ